MQRCLEWLSTNWAESFAEERTPAAFFFLDTKFILVDLVFLDFELVSTRMEKQCVVSKVARLNNIDSGLKKSILALGNLEHDFEHQVGSCRHQHMTAILIFLCYRLQQLRCPSC